MFCAKCGSAIAEGAGFCGKCGTRAGAQAIRASGRGSEARVAAEQASLAAQEYARLRNRRTNCLIAGIMLAFLLGYAFQIPVRSPENAGYAIFMAAFGGFVGLTFPFGFMPIKDFIADHGFFIVFAAVFVVILIYLVVIFTLFAGVPYFFHLQSRIASAKRDMELLRGHAEALAATAR